MAEPQKKPAQSDPWEEEAKSFKPSPQGAPASMESGNDDWKVWQHGGDSGTDQPQGNAVQRAFDKLTTVTPEQEQGHGAVVNAAQKFGAGAIGSLSPLVHPLNTIGSMAGNTVQAIAHPIDTLHQDVDEVRANPWQAAGGLVGAAALGGLAEEIPGGGGVFGAPKGPGTIGRVMEKIPTSAKAGELHEALNQKLANQPVTLNQTLPKLQRATELGERGGTLPTPVNKFLIRSQSPIDMTFPEARDYQSNMSALTREDEGMRGPMRGGVKQLNKAYFQDMKTAAGPYGEDYQNAMDMTRRAALLRKAATNIGKVVIPAAIGGTAYKLSKALQ